MDNTRSLLIALACFPSSLVCLLYQLKFRVQSLFRERGKVMGKGARSLATGGAKEVVSGASYYGIGSL